MFLNRATDLVFEFTFAVRKLRCHDVCSRQIKKIIELGSNSLHPPCQGGSETYRSEIIACQSVIAGCDTSEVLQPIESGLDAPAQLVEARAEAKRLLPV